MKINLITSLIILLLTSCRTINRTLHPDNYHFKATQLDVDYGIAGEIGEKIVISDRGEGNNLSLMLPRERAAYLDMDEHRMIRWKAYSRSPEGWLKFRLANLSQSYAEGWINNNLYMQRVDEAKQVVQNWVEANEDRERRDRAKLEREKRAWENAGTDGINWANEYMNSKARGYNPAASAIRAQNTMPNY